MYSWDECLILRKREVYERKYRVQEEGECVCRVSECNIHHESESVY